MEIFIHKRIHEKDKIISTKLRKIILKKSDGLLNIYFRNFGSYSLIK
jgi:hypothetical protein